MPKKKTTDAVKLLLRLPKRLHRRLVQQAKQGNVSLNTEIVNQLGASQEASVEWMANIIAAKIAAKLGRDQRDWEAITLVLRRLDREAPAEIKRSLHRLEVLLRGEGEVEQPARPLHSQASGSLLEADIERHVRRLASERQTEAAPPTPISQAGGLLGHLSDERLPDETEDQWEARKDEKAPEDK